MSLAKKRIVDPVLTELSLGYTSPGMIATMIFQEVQVIKEGGKIPQFTKEAFRKFETLRAVRGDSNKRNADDRDTIDFVLQEHDIAAPIDYREIEESAFDEREIETENNKTILMLELERAVAGIVTNPSNYAAGHAVALSGTDKISDPGSKPIDLAEAAKEKVRSAIGHRPEYMWMSASVLSAMNTNPQILGAMRTTVNTVPTLDDLKQMFRVKEIFVGDAVQAEDDDSFSDIWGDGFGFFYKREARSARTPNFGYTLKKRNGEFVDTYEGEGGKILNVRSTMIYTPKQTSDVAAFIYTEAV